MILVPIEAVADTGKGQAPNESVRDYILRTLRDAIVHGVFAPGQRLIEADLHAELGVSRPSLREALRQLEAERLVRIVPHKGPSVAEVSWQEAEQIYEVRELLEGHAAFLFAQRVEPAQIIRMERALKKFEQAARKAPQLSILLESTREFYDVMLTGCANQIIADTLSGLFARINRLRSQSMSLSGRSIDSADEMRRIYQAIKARDPEAARQAAIAHVRKARDAAQIALRAAARSQPWKSRGGV